MEFIVRSCGCILLFDAAGVMGSAIGHASSEVHRQPQECNTLKTAAESEWELTAAEKMEKRRKGR
jgi:hypothetical protein